MPKFNWGRKTQKPQKVTIKVYDEDGVELFDEYDYEELYGWGRKPKSKEDDWNDYSKTGVWKGYEAYKPSTFTYSYVQQMANAIAAERNITIQVGNDWQVDLDKKVLTYNPITLMRMSKGELLATLLHEVGKIALCEPMKTIDNSYIKKYGAIAYEALTTFDDFRVDNVMINSYPSAPEIYESQGGIIKEVVKAYEEKSQYTRKVIKQRLDEIHRDVSALCAKYPTEPFNRLLEKAAKVRGISRVITPLGSLEEFELWKNKYAMDMGINIYDYLACVIDLGYEINFRKYDPLLTDRWEKTKTGVEEAVVKNSTQEVSDMMDVAVFPHIEDLLEKNENGSDGLKDGLGAGGAREMMNHVKQVLGQGMDGQGNPKSRANGNLAGRSEIPLEWEQGDYEPLRESVQSEIASLVRKMTNLRRQESVPRFMHNQRRGKLNTKVLYKHRTGNNRLFKRKEIQNDTIRSFVFSIMVDVSGSMSGSRIVHTTRGLIILMEVFNKLGMEYEVIHFDDDAKVTKAFGDKLDAKKKKKVAGFITRSGNGTQLESALKTCQLLKRTEKNKVAVVLTDGDTGNHQMYNQQFFTPWEKKGIQSIVLGLETSLSSIQELNNGKGVAIQNAAEMPQTFYELIKKTIFKK